jgi:predicted small lipoprotein YifL
MFKKLVVGVAVLSLVVALTGCGNKQPAPTANQQTGTTSPTAQTTPSGHPAETPVQPNAAAGKVDSSQVESKIKDLLDKKYPGEWKVTDTTLSKGSYTENKNYKIVDDIEALFPGTMGVSIFVGEERISSSVKQGTERVLQGYPTPATVGEVIKSGKSTSTESSGYLKVYIPLKTGDKTLAVLTVSVPKQ